MQTIVKKFLNGKQPLNQNIRMLDILSEAGEVSKEVIKSQDYGKKNFEITLDMKMEIGDLLYSILAFCEENNIDSKQCLIMAIKKYEKRLLKNGNIGSN